MSVRLGPAVPVPALAVTTPTTHGWFPRMVNDGTMISGTTRLAPALAAPPIEKLASLLSQRRGVATVHTRSRARLVVGPVTAQACAPSLSTLAKSVVQE